MPEPQELQALTAFAATDQRVATVAAEIASAVHELAYALVQHEAVIDGRSHAYWSQQIAYMDRQLRESLERALSQTTPKEPSP